MTDKERPVYIDSIKVEAKTGSAYPQSFWKKVGNRQKRKLGDVFGIDQFGVNLTTLPPGAWSALRHWHYNEDEFVYILSGEVTLINDDGDFLLTEGMCAGFPSGVKNGHHLVNRSDQTASFLEVGSRADNEKAVYPDEDLLVSRDENGFVFTDRNNVAYDDSDKKG